MNRALWHNSGDFSELRQVNYGALESGVLEIKSLYSLISTGTERLVAKGFVPENAREAMRVPYMEGDFGFPVKYGYSLVGEVVTPGAFFGKKVHLLHPHQEVIRVNSSAIFEIPQAVPAKRATLASNVETVVNAIWDAGVSVGDRVLVAGFGMIGSLLSRVLKMMPAVELFVLEKDENKRQLARQQGFQLMEDIPEHYFDAAFNTTANGNALQQCILSVGTEGKIIELSWYGNAAVNLQLGSDFHYLRKKIISSQVSRIPAARSIRWDYKRRKKVVFELLKSDVFDNHINKVILFEESPAFFKDLRQGNFEGLGCCIKYHSDKVLP